MSGDADSQLQGDQLYVVVGFYQLGKVTWPMYACTVVYTGQATFFMVPEKHGHV